jgi:hypothetical protein
MLGLKMAGGRFAAALSEYGLFQFKYDRKTPSEDPVSVRPVILSEMAKKRRARQGLAKRVPRG